MREDRWLIGIVSAIWIALAALYALVPMFSMPGSALVWGSGAAIFLGLTALIVQAERCPARRRAERKHPTREPNGNLRGEL